MNVSKSQYYEFRHNIMNLGNQNSKYSWRIRDLENPQTGTQLANSVLMYKIGIILVWMIFHWICHDLQDNALSLKLDLYGIRGAPFDLGGDGSWCRVIFFFFTPLMDEVFFNVFYLFIYLFIYFGLTGGSILFIQKLPFCHRISGSGWNFVCLFVCLSFYFLG